MEWLDRFSAKKGVVGIEVLPAGLAIAAVGCLGKADEVDLLHLLERESPQDDLQKPLQHFIQQHKVANRLCHLVLSGKDYQLLLAEAPEVPDDEMREAVRWKIKDLISMPIDKAVIDVFRLPVDANKSSKPMIYAVIADIDRVQSLITMVNDSGLTLASIDIGEMAMRNLSFVMANDLFERGLGVVRLSQGGGAFSLYREGNLYLSRQFKLDYNGGLLDDLPVEALALEVQRSLDYYERQMGLSPPSAIFLGGENVSEDKISQELVRSVNVQVRHMNMTNGLHFGQDMEEGMMQMCAGALGGAFREKVIA